MNAECEEIGQELTGFIGAWHRIDVACNTLLSEVELFNKLSVSLVIDVGSKVTYNILTWRRACPALLARI